MATVQTILAPVSFVRRTAVASDAVSESQKETITIEFGDDTQPVVIDPSDPQARLYSDVINALESNQLAWMEVDADTRRLRTLEIPIVAPIADLYEQPTGDLTVRLVGSPALRTLKRSEPRFEELAGTLRQAASERAQVALTERDDTRDIVKAQKVVRPFDRPLAVPRPLLFDDDVVANFTVVTADQALAAFDHLSGRACDALHVNSSCIPFLYPDDGCTGRAHLMCELLSQVSHTLPGMPDITSGKIWHHGDPRAPYDVATPNAPDCKVPFVFHCAPVVRVDGAGLQVIDPSFFDRPVSDADWHDIQNAGGRRMITDRVVYYAEEPRVGVAFDPVGEQARLVLGYARSKLVLRVNEKRQPPPYCRI